MRIVQLSDFHVRGDGRLSFRIVDTRRCLDETVAHLKKEQKPDALVLTGDLADNGDTDAYRILRESITSLGWATYAIPGNHDRRDQMRKILPEWCPAEDPGITPYLCYTVEKGPVRLVMIDTTNPGSHDGHCHPAVMVWLDKTLAWRPHMPTLLFMHHPPFITGLPIMDVPIENVGALAAILRKNPQMRLCCGHIHRPIQSQWEGVLAITAPAVSMQIELDLGEKGGDEFRMETPGYLLHHWSRGILNTHVCQIATQASFAGPYPFADSENPGELP